MAGTIGGIAGDGHEVTGGEEFIAIDSCVELVTEHDFGFELISKEDLEIGVGGLDKVRRYDATVVGHKFGEGGVGLEHRDASGGNATDGSDVNVTKASGHSAGNAVVLVGEGLESDLWALFKQERKVRAGKRAYAGDFRYCYVDLAALEDHG
jgi:hypothetical protein